MYRGFYEMLFKSGFVRVCEETKEVSVEFDTGGMMVCKFKKEDWGKVLDLLDEMGYEIIKSSSPEYNTYFKSER